MLCIYVYIIEQTEIDYMLADLRDIFPNILHNETEKLTTDFLSGKRHKYI